MRYDLSVYVMCFRCYPGRGELVLFGVLNRPGLEHNEKNLLTIHLPYKCRRWTFICQSSFHIEMAVFILHIMIV